MNYTVQFFINKFSAIPEDRWYKGKLRDPEDYARCALGHCLGQRIRVYFDDVCIPTDESRALNKLFYQIDTCVDSVNDGRVDRYPQSTTKKRILAALYDIAKKQGIEVKKPEIEIPPTKTKEAIRYVSVSASLKKAIPELIQN